MPPGTANLGGMGRKHRHVKSNQSNESTQALIVWAHSHGFLSVSNLDDEQQAATKIVKGLTFRVREHFYKTRVIPFDGKERVERYYATPTFSAVEKYVASLQLREGFGIDTRRSGLSAVITAKYNEIESIESLGVSA